MLEIVRFLTIIGFQILPPFLLGLELLDFMDSKQFCWLFLSTKSTETYKVTLKQFSTIKGMRLDAWRRDSSHQNDEWLAGFI